MREDNKKSNDDSEVVAAVNISHILLMINMLHHPLILSLII